MTSNNRFIIVTTLVTIFSTLLFNNIYASDFLVDTARNMIDTTSINIADLQQNLDLASLLPFHEHYMSWDTTKIHPYDFDLTKMNDTVMLVLSDHSDCAFAAPVMGYVTSNFGQRTRSRYHYGIDLKLETGDSVVSAFDGIVRISQYSYSYGNCVVVRHYNGLETLYAHLSERNVNPGQAVRAGELVGYGGNTGHSSGPHLHFEVRYKGQAMDPNTLIDFNDSLNRSLKTDTMNVSKDNFDYLVKFRKSASRYGYSAGGKYYTIRSGDNLSTIAVRNHTTVNRLCQLNRMSRNSILRPGRKLRIK